MRKLTILTSILSLLTVNLPAVAKTLPIEEPMSFAWKQIDGRLMQMGLMQTIYAEGIITPGTAGRLKSFLGKHKAIPGALIILDSAGGNLSEGLRLGRLIRSRLLVTEVGGREVGGQSICMSACTLAFLGGVTRYVPEEARFGVHRFFVPGNGIPGSDAMEYSQVEESEILEYVTQMGVKPGFILEMNKASPFEINILSQNRMKELNIITPEYVTKWEIRATPWGEIYVAGVTTDERGTHKVLISCPQSAQSGGAFMVFLYDVGGDASAALFLNSVSLQIDDKEIELKPDEIIAMPHMHGKYIETAVKLDQRIRQLMSHAQKFGLEMLPPSHQTFVGFTGDFQGGRNKVLGYLASCH